MIILRKLNVYKEVTSEDEAAALKAKGFERVNDKAEDEYTSKAEDKAAETEGAENISLEAEPSEKEEDDDGAKKATAKGKNSGKGK